MCRVSSLARMNTRSPKVRTTIRVINATMLDSQASDLMKKPSTASRKKALKRAQRARETSCSDSNALYRSDVLWTVDLIVVDWSNVFNSKWRRHHTQFSCQFSNVTLKCWRPARMSEWLRSSDSVLSSAANGHHLEDEVAQSRLAHQQPPNCLQSAFLTLKFLIKLFVMRARSSYAVCTTSAH